MRRTRTIVLCSAMVLAAAAQAAAQTWTERVFISVNGAFQPSSHDFSDHFTFDSNQETGSTDVDYAVDSGFVFDAGVGYRLWKNLGAGVAFSYFTRDDVAHTTSSFPHPFVFNQPREVTGDATGIARKETAVHVQVMYMWNAGPVRVVLSAGPSFFNVEQDLVTAVQISETFPFDTATFASAQTRSEKSSAPAFNAGADIAWMFSRNIGAGGIIRFAKASVDLDAGPNRTISVDAGGVYVGGGLRILF